MAAIKLVLTCNACPEQYDAYFDGVQIGYLRLRHGRFTVTSPDACGELVYAVHPFGDGVFANEAERQEHLNAACKALLKWHGLLPLDGSGNAYFIEGQEQRT